MTELDGPLLRALIRLIPPARALKEEAEKSLHLEMQEGVGDFALQSYRGLHARILEVTADTYLAALRLDADAAADDRQKMAATVLAAGQMVAYLEGQTGVPSGYTRTDIEIVRAPKINISGPIHGMPPEVIAQLAEIASAASGSASAADGSTADSTAVPANDEGGLSA
jgi:hypothetical protein